MAHSKFSPSSAHRWMACAGSIFLERDLPDNGNKYSREGTLAHDLAARCLTTGSDAASYVGNYLAEDPELAGAKITPEMAGYVQVYVDNVRGYLAKGVQMQVEQRVDFSEAIGQPDQAGTADVLILSADGRTLRVIDLKYGMGVVVDAELNPQAQLYALGAIKKYELFADIEEVIVEIHMPRLEHVSQWALPVADLHAFAKKARTAAAKSQDIIDTGIVGLEDLATGDHCKFCKAKASCPKLQAQVQELTGCLTPALDVDFGPPDLIDGCDVSPTQSPLEKISGYTMANLSVAMSAVSLVEQWCDAVRAETERRIFAGEHVEGYKLVQGKRGARKWSDPEEAEKYLRQACRHDEIYEKVLLSPAKLEKRFKPWIDEDGTERKPVLGPRQQTRIADLVVQDNGKPSVAPVSDKRPALVLECNFDDIV